jgi:hypothetical protein
MADDRIDIEINDKIDANISKKLRDIATGADAGESSVKKLKDALATVTDTPTKKLKDATDNATSSLNKELTAQTKVKAAHDTTTVSIDKEVAAQQRLSKVIDETIARYNAQAAAASRSGPIAGPTGSKALAAAQTAGMASGLTPGEQAAALTASNAAAANFKGFLGSGGAEKVEQEAKSIASLGTSAKLNSTAIRELFVLAREGGRGDFTRMAGSVTVLAGALGILETVMLPVAITLGVVAGAMKLFQLSIASEANPQLQAYANTLGLTHKEMRKLGDETLGANGKLKEFNTVQLQFADVWHGLIKTVSDYTGVKDALGNLKKNTLSVLDDLVKGAVNATAGIYAAFVGTYEVIRKGWSNLPGLFEVFFIACANEAIKDLETIANMSISVLNGIAQGINKVFGSNIAQIADVHIPRLKAATGSSAEDIGNTYNAAFNRAKAGMTGFYNDWKKNSIQAAKDRLREEANAVINNRNPKKPSNADPKTKADYLNDENKKLDDELNRMHMLKDAREEQQRLDQIEEEFLKRRMPLNAQEIQSFAAKIHAIQEYKYVQAEMDKIYTAVIGPQRDFNASVAAANELLTKGAISLDDYNKQLVLAGRKLAEAKDPLFQLKEAMNTAEAATHNYGDQVQKANYYEQIRQAMLKDGVVLSMNYVAGVNSEVDALMRRNAALQQSQFVQSQVGSVVNPILEDQKMRDSKAAVYAEIDRLRKMDVLNEEQAQRAKLAFQIKADEQRLGAASDFFGALADVTKGGNGAIGAINKAAAIAQATIDGFVATQKALASAPPPWNFVAAAAVALKTGMMVAKIASTNVGSYQNGGAFIVDGRAGVDRNNINMNVSRGERVTIETPAQQRASDKNGGGTNVSVNPKIVNLFDEKSFVGAMDSEDGEEVIMNVIARRKSDVKQMMGG